MGLTTPKKVAVTAAIERCNAMEVSGHCTPVCCYTHTEDAAKNVDEQQSKYFGRKAVSFVFITITGGVALSALDDLSIYHGCSSFS
ncbi:hypothetical protein TSUD_336490 [Trifolium subterraneum]|uniref:Uncharacterized protein n=1 Tax=Trifolium subterraneum TaxID=3900 RepID=A0A2Z6LMR1_TRISU|nr:hypothetical protein TSUD_336490 [Trifolium subterraneum]